MSESMGRLLSPAQTDGWNPPFSRGAILRLLQQTCYCPSDIIKNLRRINHLGLCPKAHSVRLPPDRLCPLDPRSPVRALTYSESPLQFRHQIGALPREAAVLLRLAAEVAIGSRALVD